MSWRDRIGQAGFFRDVPFFYDSADTEVGRRNVVFEFPGRDQPFVEDLGLRTRRFTIDMYVVGPDYDAARDKLRAALEQPGPGELEHPYYGTLQVSVDGPVRIRESVREGGIARFSVTFVEGGATLAVTVAPLTVAGLLNAVQALDAAIRKAISEAFSIVGAITDVIDAAASLVNEMGSLLNFVNGKIAAALQVINDVREAVQAVADGMTTLLQTPERLVNTMVGLYATVLGGINEVTDAFTEQLAFFGGEDGVPALGLAASSSTRTDLLTKAVNDMATYGSTLKELPENTVQQRIESNNQRQLVRLARLAAVNEAARTAAGMTFDNTTQTAAVRDAVVALVDLVLTTDEDLPDELYAPLVDVQANLVQFLDQAASTLPDLADYTPQVTLPALVIAYQLYGDATRESELLLRNPQLRDPSAVPGGQPLKVKVADA